MSAITLEGWLNDASGENHWELYESLHPLQKYMMGGSVFWHIPYEGVGEKGLSRLLGDHVGCKVSITITTLVPYEEPKENDA